MEIILSKNLTIINKKNSVLKTEENQYLEAVEEWLAEKAGNGFDNGTAWQKFCASFRQFLRNLGLNIAYSDNDIQNLFRQAASRLNGENGSVRNSGNLRSARYDIGNDNSIDPEIRQAFPKYSSSQAKEVLKNFPKEGAVNKDTGINAQLSRRQRGKLFSRDAIIKSKANGFFYEQHLEAVANIQDLYENAVLLVKTDDLKNNDPNVKIYRFASPFVIGEEIADALLTVKESLDKNSKKIYSLELTEIKKLSAKGGTLEYHTDSINKLQQKHEKVKQFLEKNQEKIRKSIAPQVDTPAFKNWFEYSKVVDSDMKNWLILYT